MSRNEAAMRRQPTPNIVQREFAALSDTDKQIMRGDGLGPESDDDAVAPRRRRAPQRPAQQASASGVVATVLGVIGALTLAGAAAWLGWRYLRPALKNGAA